MVVIFYQFVYLLLTTTPKLIIISLISVAPALGLIEGEAEALGLIEEEGEIEGETELDGLTEGLGETEAEGEVPAGRNATNIPHS